MNEIKYLYELDADKSIKWWNDNRAKINDVIRLFNEWQIEHTFDEKQKKILLARIEVLKEYGNEHSFSEWQFEMIDEMEAHIKKVEEKKRGCEINGVA